MSTLRHIKNQKGVILPTLMISTIVVLAIVLVIAQTIVDNYKTVLQEQYRVNAQIAADAGVDYSITQLNDDEDWTGVSETDLFDNGDFRTTYQATVSNLANDNKELTVTANTYAPSTETNPTTTKTIVVELYSVGGGGTASIVTGVGGLILENSAKIVAGDVVVNGDITMSNSAQIGTTTNSVTVKAAHQNCPSPADATYPQVCAAGENGEPISLSNSAHIYGTVQATNQVDGSGMSNPGLSTGSPSPEPLPTHDRDAQKAAATNNMTAAAASCNSNSGTRIIPANTHITGGDVEWKKKCDITILGDIWIDGSVYMTNTAEVIVDETVGATKPNIMVDGSSGFNMDNSSALTANSFDTGVQIITYHSAAACSPDCADVTGVDLYDSRLIPTLTLNQSAQGPESIFFAKWSQVNIVNSGDIGALVGQTVRMRNSSTVTFGTSIPGYEQPTIWLVYSYRQS